MLRSALLVLSGNAFASLLQLARNLIVARMLSVADYGVASTFVVALAVVEMASALGLQHQIVQAREGDDVRFQAALQGFQVLRGLLSGAVFFVVAGPMASFMGIPEVVWAYRLMALVPVLNALVHFDIYRLNREMVFWPMLLTGVLPAFLSLLALWPLALWIDDWRLMPYSILLQAVLGVVVSHLLARRAYRLVWDRGIMAQSLRFGWPILANAVLLFFVFHGDRLIVARVAGMEALAIFSMGVTLTLAPTMVASQSLRNFFLPQLARTHAARATAPADFAQSAQITLQAAVLGGALMVGAMAVLAVPIVHVLLGPRYGALIPLMVPLAVLGGIRICKSGPAVVALAAGRTGNATFANLPRVLALPLAWYLLHDSGNLMLVIWLGIAAELLGHGLALALMGRRLAVSLAPAAQAMFLAYAGIVLAASSLAAGEGRITDWHVALLAVLLLPPLLVAMPQLRAHVVRKGRPRP